MRNNALKLHCNTHSYLQDTGTGKIQKTKQYIQGISIILFSLWNRIIKGTSWRGRFTWHLKLNQNDDVGHTKMKIIRHSFSFDIPTWQHTRQASICDAKEPTSTHWGESIKPLEEELQFIPFQKISSISQFILDIPL